MSDVTQVLDAIEQGDPKASAELLPLVYEELRRLAAQHLANENPGQTLQATALVHEAYLRLVDDGDVRHWDSRGHFFGAAARAMRRILVDSARRKRSLKGGGGLRKRDVLLQEPAIEPPGDDLLALDESLKKLAEKDARKARLVELRSFAGLTNAQAAKCLGVSTATAERDWAYARAWLHQEIIRSDDSGRAAP